DLQADLADAGFGAGDRGIDLAAFAEQPGTVPIGRVDTVALDQVAVGKPLDLLVFVVEQRDFPVLRGTLRLQAPDLLADLLDAEFKLLLLALPVVPVSLED